MVVRSSGFLGIPNPDRQEELFAVINQYKDPTTNVLDASNPDYKAATDSVVVPKREFITAAIPTEKSANNKIYKEFGKKFVKLLSKSIRKR